MDAYRKAADCYATEDQNTSKCQMLLKVAHYAATLDDFKQAIDLYEEVGHDYLLKQLTAPSCKEVYFKAMLCHMVIAAKNKTPLGTYAELDVALDKYKTSYPGFDDSRESKLVEGVMEGMKEEDIEKIQNAIVEFDTIVRLDDWKAGLLIQIKALVQKSADQETPMN